MEHHPPQKKIILFYLIFSKYTSICFNVLPLFQKSLSFHVHNKHSFRYFLPYIFLETFSGDCSLNKNILWAFSNLCALLCCVDYDVKEYFVWYLHHYICNKVHGTHGLKYWKILSEWKILIQLCWHICLLY